MRAWARVGILLLGCLVLGCGDGRSEDDGGAARRDAGAELDGGRVDRDGGDRDGGDRDGGAPRDASSPDDGGSGPEDCATDADEDGNGYAGCDDPVCWDEARCVQDELATNDLAGWSHCGETSMRDAEAMATRCEEGLPPGSPSTRTLSCREIASTVTLETFCPPGGGDERALRWTLTADTAGSTEMIGPNTYESTSYTVDTTFTVLWLTYGGGASSGEGSFPVREAYAAPGYRSVAWLTHRRVGDGVFVAPTAYRDVTTIIVHGGGTVTSTSEDPALFIAAAFELTLE